MPGVAFSSTTCEEVQVRSGIQLLNLGEDDQTHGCDRARNMQAECRKKHATVSSRLTRRPYSICDTHAIQCLHRLVLSDVHVGSTH